MFVKLYLSDGGSQDRTSLAALDTAFRAAYVPENPYTSSFQGRTAININATSPDDARLVLANRTVNDSVHPGCDSERCPEGDPTLLAVVIGTYVGKFVLCAYMYMCTVAIEYCWIVKVQLHGSNFGAKIFCKMLADFNTQT